MVIMTAGQMTKPNITFNKIEEKPENIKILYNLFSIDLL